MISLAHQVMTESGFLSPFPQLQYISQSTLLQYYDVRPEEKREELPSSMTKTFSLFEEKETLKKVSFSRQS